jgi:UPF0176 protein
MKEKAYFVLAYYQFVSIEEPLLEIKKHKEFFKDRDVSGRIYISEKGINGQMSAYKDDAEAYMLWMRENDCFKNIQFKVHYSDENVFPRMTVKYRKQIVALDSDVEAADGGEHVSPKKWKEMLEDDEEYLLLDVRNDYEWEVGHFEGALKPALETFREFPEFAENLKDDVDPKKTKVMMYCTGGIRCELYSALMKDKGFENVYQLDGGVINYGLKEGSKYWKGKLFVFDDRLTVPIADEKVEIISKCKFCQEPSDDYLNCANMDCNTLFLCCSNCLESAKGCCQTACQDAPRVRPWEQQNPHKPFRRQHTYVQNHD